MKFWANWGPKGNHFMLIKLVFLHISHISNYHVSCATWCVVGKHFCCCINQIFTKWCFIASFMVLQLMAVIVERDAALLEKNIAIVEKMVAWAEWDATFLQWNAALTNRDFALLKRDVTISALTKVITTLGSNS